MLLYFLPEISVCFHVNTIALSFYFDLYVTGNYLAKYFECQIFSISYAQMTVRT